MTVVNNLVAFYLGMYNTKSVSLMLLISTSVSIEVFLSIYKTFVAEKVIPPIEELPKEEKLKLVDECRQTGLKFTNETLTNSARILYVLKYINDNANA